MFIHFLQYFWKKFSPASESSPLSLIHTVLKWVMVFSRVRKAAESCNHHHSQDDKKSTCFRRCSLGKARLRNSSFLWAASLIFSSCMPRLTAATVSVAIALIQLQSCACIQWICRQFRIITLNLCFWEFGGFSRIWKGPSLNGKKHLAFVQAACVISSWFPTEQRAKLVSAACLLFLIFGQPWEPANARESKDTSQRVIFVADTIHTGWTLDALIDHTILICLINFRKFPC